VKNIKPRWEWDGTGAYDEDANGDPVQHLIIVERIFEILSEE